MRVRRGSSAQAGPVDALDREVVGLGAAGGEDHLAGPAAQRLRDRLAGLLDRPGARAVPTRAGARVADLEEMAVIASTARAPSGWWRRGRGRRCARRGP
jgi:hypothetical protein